MEVVVQYMLMEYTDLVLDLVLVGEVKVGNKKLLEREVRPVVARVEVVNKQINPVAGVVVIVLKNADAVVTPVVKILLKGAGSEVSNQVVMAHHHQQLELHQKMLIPRMKKIQVCLITMLQYVCYIL